jgi:hypothetical protein
MATRELLILGAGWTSNFLIPLLQEKSISYAATTRSGHDNTIPFTFDPESDDPTPFKNLPTAKTVLITFPIKLSGATKKLVSFYNSTHTPTSQFIQLGSTGVWTYEGATNRHTPIDTTDSRGAEENQLLSIDGTVLNLAGLWGGTRHPKNWLPRIAKDKEQLKNKKTVHLVHGEDVARAIVGLHENWGKVRGQRWLLSDLRAYDWWELAMAWGDAGMRGWVLECMREEGVGTLSRNREEGMRVLDARDVWDVVGMAPVKGLLC